ncbi:MAG TPA: TPM domain-containing protein [Burkholderiaceae bacterium]|nr:TPM domain-containing protein [Burkholderiaceae bacterium]
MERGPARIWAHLVCDARSVRRSFPDPVLERIEQAVSEGERRHGAEVRIAIEAGMHWTRVLRGVSPRERAIEVFSELRVWDTEANNGVLLYLLLADHAIEIVADRAAAAALSTARMQQACERLRAAFVEERYEQGVLEALAVLHEDLALAFPISAQAGHADADELPNRPAIL